MVFTKLQYNKVFYDVAVSGKFARKNRKMTHQFSLSTENKCQFTHPFRQIYMEIVNKLNKSKIFRFRIFKANSTYSGFELE